VRVALAQLNTVVGDVDGNAERVRAAIVEAEGAGADVTVVPELALTGYPPEDLLLRPQFARDSQRALERVAPAVHRGVAVIGFAEWDRECFNSAAVLPSSIWATRLRECVAATIRSTRILEACAERALATS